MEQSPTLTLSSFEKLIEELRKYPEIVNELKKAEKKKKDAKKETPCPEPREGGVSFVVRFD